MSTTWLDFVLRVEANHGWKPPTRINHGGKKLQPPKRKPKPQHPDVKRRKRRRS
jgi:hypothetical protein